MSIGPLMIDIESTSLSTDETQLLKNPLIGGVILFSRNYESIKQLEDLVYQIRNSRASPILIAVDHEGGSVQRFKEGFTVLPPLSSYGKLVDLDIDKGMKAAGYGGWISAIELLSVGIDLNLSPVLDLQSNISPVIGSRAFHSTPNMVASIGRVFIEGMLQAGMQAVGKHFPGHGSVTGDSHHQCIVDSRDAETILHDDMCPFMQLGRTCLAGIMTAHVSYPALDDKPVTYSKYWLKTILREKNDYKGAVISDDLSMKGAAIYESMVERAMTALDAGCDMLILCHNRPAVYDILDALANYRNPLAEHRLIRLCGHFQLTRRELENFNKWQEAKIWLADNIAIVG